MPTPAGTTTFFRLTKTSRCEWTWRKTNSCVSGVRPAFRVSAIGFGGAGQTGASAAAASKAARRSIGRAYNRGVSEIDRRDEVQAAIEARKELGAEHEPALIDSFVERIERRLSERAEESERSLKRRREHQKEMVLGAMAISIRCSRSRRSSRASRG